MSVTRHGTKRRYTKSSEFSIQRTPRTREKPFLFIQSSTKQQQQKNEAKINNILLEKLEYILCSQYHKAHQSIDCFLVTIPIKRKSSKEIQTLTRNAEQKRDGQKHSKLEKQNEI